MTMTMALPPKPLLQLKLPHRYRPLALLGHAESHESCRPFVGYDPDPQPGVAGNGQREGGRPRTGADDDVGNTFAVEEFGDVDDGL